MRAPAPSLMPMNGAPTDSARSMTLWIFSAKTSPRAPPKTVKSWEKTKTLRPSTVPQPVTTPSVSGPGVLDLEAVGPVAGQHVQLHEAAGVEEHVEPFPGGELALGVLALDGRRAAGVKGRLLELAELLDPLPQGVGDGRRP